MLRKSANKRSEISRYTRFCTDAGSFSLVGPAQQYTNLSSSVARVKSVSARLINQHLDRKGSVWQSGYYDHAIRKEEDVVHVARYIVANPLRAGLVRSLNDFSLWDAVWL